MALRAVPCCQPSGRHRDGAASREERHPVDRGRALRCSFPPATRADAPGIVWVSNSSILPGEDVGFGGGMDSPFHDASILAAAWRDPNLVQVEQVLAAEIDGRLSAARPSRTEEANSSSSTSTSRCSFRAKGSARRGTRQPTVQVAGWSGRRTPKPLTASLSRTCPGACSSVTLAALSSSSSASRAA
jgi:hypothetical protein